MKDCPAIKEIADLGTRRSSEGLRIRQALELDELKRKYQTDLAALREKQERELAEALRGSADLGEKK